MHKFELFFQGHFDDFKTIPFSGVPFSSEVRRLCEQNTCGNLGKSWTCPPAVAPPEELKDQLSRFHRVVIVNKVYPLEDSFDWEGMKSGAKNFQGTILALKKEIRKTAPHTQFIALGAGACQICERCTYEQHRPCRNPEDAIVSVEACGIDVMEMTKTNGLSYNNGANTITYVGALFYQLSGD